MIDVGHVTRVLALLWRLRGKEKLRNIWVESVISAIQVQYRQSVQLGDRFAIRSRVHGWDDRAFYLEQWMTMERTKETACSFLVRLALIPRRLTPQMLVDDLQMGPISSPPLSSVMHRFRDNHRLNFSSIQSKL